MDGLSDLFQIDWNIFMSGARAWLAGGNPYGALSADLGAGAFAYPPTALPWLALFVPLGGLGFYVWTALTLAGWWLIIRREAALRWQLILLLWSPIVLHLVQGQSTLPVILVLWAAHRANRRTFLWGLVAAWALTKPQAAVLPVLWLLWQDRKLPDVWRFAGGIALGTVLLALPATLRDPQIWMRWIESLTAYRERILQLAPWQQYGAPLVLLVAWLWHRRQIGGWQWFATAALFPQPSFYGTVALLPVLRPNQSGWTLGALAIAGVLQGPMTPFSLPLILGGHLLAGYMLARGMQKRVGVEHRKPLHSQPSSN